MVSSILDLVIVYTDRKSTYRDAAPTPLHSDVVTFIAKSLLSSDTFHAFTLHTNVATR